MNLEYAPIVQLAAKGTCGLTSGIRTTEACSSIYLWPRNSCGAFCCEMIHGKEEIGSEGGFEVACADAEQDSRHDARDLQF